MGKYTDDYENWRVTNHNRKQGRLLHKQRFLDHYNNYIALLIFNRIWDRLIFSYPYQGLFFSDMDEIQSEHG